MNLKPHLIIILLYLPFTQEINSQDWNTFANTSRYDKANLELKLHTKANNRVVFMGNSITEGWIQMRPEFFNNRDYINRGIGGQTTPSPNNYIIVFTIYPRNKFSRLEYICKYKPL